ncbi:MAG: glycosyltransferase family 4 protein [Anaerolineaceae bacterium]|nr:glycosyltransferase family 4 protein [Anaerolineaceae bacterium]
MNKKNVLMFVNTFAYDDPRVIAEARTLHQAGYSVTIIGAARNTNRDVPTQGIHHDIPIILTPLVKTYHIKEIGIAFWQWLNGSLAETAQASKFHKTNVISLLFFNLWCWRLARQQRPDIIHCHDFSPLPTAWLLARLRRIPFIYDAHESAPDMYAGTKARVVKRAEAFFMRRATHTITVGNRLAQSLVARGAKSVTVIGNWKSKADFQIESPQLQAERTRLGLNSYHLVITYLGTLSPAREILPLLQAVSDTPDVALLIGGSGPLEENVIRVAEKAANIYWLGWVNMLQLPLYTQLADVIYYCLATPSDPSAERNNYYSTPNKLFEAFAAGKPLIAHQGVGEIGEILEKIPAALLLEAVTVEQLRAAFQQLQNPDTLSRLQQAALQGGEQYSWQVAEKRLLGLYKELTESYAAN